MDGNIVMLIAGAALILAAVIGVILVILKFMKTGAKKYKVDYSGEKELYKGAKDSYRAGSRVRLYYDLIATDTDYAFFVDGIKLNHGFDNDKGFIISFIMPAHDVIIEHSAENSMVEKENNELPD